MKRTKHFLFFVALISLFSCTNEDTEADIKGIEDYLTTTGCLADSSWFDTLSDGRRVTTAPIEQGIHSPFHNNTTVTNCDFHRWSWQKFLWLTNEDVNGTPAFITDLHQITAEGDTINNSALVLTSTGQASGPQDILQTSGSNSKTVYYAIFADDSLYKNILKYAPIAKEYPDSVVTQTFPVGALEVKTSWVDVSTFATSVDTSSFYITNAFIAGASTTTRVALLGIHVVGVVENHPEFVWATFEHTDLAPKYPWNLSTDTSDASVTSSVDYPFFDKNTTATVTNISSNSPTHQDIFSVYEFGVPVKKVGDSVIFLNTSQNGAENVEHITSINADVKSQLKGVWNNYFYNGSLWIDTEGYEGTVAQAELLNSKGGTLHESDTSDLTRGSVAMYNLTMETFVQVETNFAYTQIHQDTNATLLMNCFSCHYPRNSGNQSPLYISHLFTGYLGNINGLSKEAIKQQHVDQIREQFKMRANKK